MKHPIDQLRAERDEAAAAGDHGTALVLNDKIAVLKDMTTEQIEEQIQGSDLYSPTVKRVMKRFSAALKKAVKKA
jgi:hypothetical protein